MQLLPGSLPGWPSGADSSSSSSSSSMNSTQPVMLVTDAVAALLQGSHALQPLPGGYLVLAANALLPTSPATAHGSRSGSRPGTAGGSRTTQPLLTSRATLGPGRHTVLGLGLSPKTPGSRRVGPQRNTLSAGRAHVRRKIRRKFEEIASFLAGAGDLLPPPPEHLLTQPPAAYGGGVWTAAAAAHAASAAGAAPASRARVNFAVGEAHSTVPAAAAGAPGSAGTQKAPRPQLTVSLDGVSGEDESASQLVWPSSTRAVAAAAAPRPASPQMVQQHATPVHAHHVVQASSSGSAAGGSRPRALSGRPGSGAKATRLGSSVQQHAKGSASGSTVSARGLASAAATSQAGSCSASAGRAQHAASGSTAGAARSSGLQARQQVWREVEALRSAGAGTVPQPVTGGRPASPFLLPLVSQASGAAAMYLTSLEYADAAGGSSISGMGGLLGLLGSGTGSTGTQQAATGSSEARRPSSPLHAAARHAVDGILAEHGCQQSPSQAQERVMQQCLVLSASKALGSVAAAEAYVAALPAGQRAVHLSTAGEGCQAHMQTSACPSLDS
jgi:hypothetical protein